MRKTFSVSPETLAQFQELVPRQERNQAIEMLMTKFITDKQNELEIMASEFELHPDFAIARADSRIWNS